MSNFYTDVIKKSPLFRSTETVKDLGLLEPDFRGKVQAIMAECGKDLRVAETYRSCERQAMLFNKHATRLKDVGVHHYGLAVDFSLFVDGKYQTDGAKDYLFLGPLCKKYGLTWGGDWGEPDKPHSFRDWDHIQAVTKRQQVALFAGKWYPSLSVGLA